MTKVKICGITNLADACAAVVAGADALGFVFYRKSPRWISPARAARICAVLPRPVERVGVFVNAAEGFVRRTRRRCRLDFLQFHGEESPAYCRIFKGARVIKAFRVRGRLDRAAVSRYNTYAYLFDSFSRTSRGGTGRRFDWRLLRGLPRSTGKTVFLSGGLTQRTVGRAIAAVRPQWVDVSSSLERSPGKKDAARMVRFIDAVRKASR